MSLREIALKNPLVILHYPLGVLKLHQLILSPLASEVIQFYKEEELYMPEINPYL
jgi:hypothetical protein